MDLVCYLELMLFGLGSVFGYDFPAGGPDPGLVIAEERQLVAISEKDRGVARVIIAHSGMMQSAKAMSNWSIQIRWVQTGRPAGLQWSARKFM